MNINRRQFLKQVVAATLAAQFMPRRENRLFASEAHRNLTFFLTSDTHVGMQYKDCTPPLTAADYAKHVEDSLGLITAIPGKPWPKIRAVTDAVRGLDKVPMPQGLIVAGDLTETGAAAQWKKFEDLLPWNGRATNRIPVFACAGNHDGGSKGRAVRTGLRTRNKAMLNVGLLATVSADGLHTAWVWQGIHFINVNLYPGDTAKEGSKPGSMWDPEKSLTFLRNYLANAVQNSQAPVIIIQHFDLAHSSWWDQERRRIFYETIKGYNVTAILHGHTHAISHWRFPDDLDWQAFGDGGPRFDCFSAGAFKHEAKRALPFPGWPRPCECYVFHLTDTQFVAAHYTGQGDGWNVGRPEAKLTVVKPLRPS